jgi:excisionase family DNA binding protein
MTNPEKDFLTVQDIATRLNLKRLAVYGLLKNHKMEHYKFGRQIRVKQEEFERFLEESKISREPSSPD